MLFSLATSSLVAAPNHLLPATRLSMLVVVPNNSCCATLSWRLASSRFFCRPGIPRAFSCLVINASWKLLLISAAFSAASLAATSKPARHCPSAGSAVLVILSAANPIAPAINPVLSANNLAIGATRLFTTVNISCATFLSSASSLS